MPTPDAERPDHEQLLPRTTSRREAVRVGLKMAFVAPLVTTFLAREARAAATRQSCSPAGAPCTANKECCSELCVANACM